MQIKLHKNNILRHLLSDKKVLIIILFLFTISIRIPFVLMNSEAYTDPGDDGASYVMGGYNIKHYQEYKIDFIRWYHRGDGYDANTITHPAFWYPPVYPALISFVLSINDSLRAIALANVFLFGMTIVIGFLLFGTLFGEKIALLSALILALNPNMYHYSTNILAETSYLLLSTLTFYLLIAKKNIHTKYLIIAGLLGGLTFLTKFIGAFVIMAGFIWLVAHKKYRAGIIFGAVSFVTLAPFFLLRNYILLGDPLIRFHGTGFNYPPIIETASADLGNWLMSNIWYMGRALLDLSENLSSPGFFWLLLPFLIIGCLRNYRDKRVSLLVIFLVTVIVGHIFVLRHSIPRYYIAIIFFLMPIAVSEMSHTLSYLCDLKIFPLSLNQQKVFMILIIMIILTSCASTFKFQRSIIANHPDFKSQYDWINENVTSDPIITSTDPQRCNYYTGLKSVTFPTNLNAEWLDKFVNFYNASYIEIHSHSKNLYIKNKYVIDTFFSGKEIINTGLLNIKLVHKSNAKFNTRWLYKVVN